MSLEQSLLPAVPGPISGPSSTLAAPIPEVQDPNDPLTSSDPYEYLASIAFHRTFFCTRTQSNVSYADCGDKNGPLLFYVLPSGCSRWVATFLDGYARAKGVRLVAPDRAGQGRTPRVPLASRFETAKLQILSLLEHLQLAAEAKVSFLTHSAGIFVLLPVLQYLLSSSLPSNSTLPLLSGRIFLSSPWIPASVSGQKLFSLIPPALAEIGYIFIPKLLGAGNKLAGIRDSVKSVLAISGINIGSSSSSSVESESKKKRARAKKSESERANSVLAYPTADIHPPFGSQANAHLTSPRVRAWIASQSSDGRKKLSPDLGMDLVFAYMTAEGFWGMSQEHALCLGGAPSANTNQDSGEKGLAGVLVGGWKDVGRAWAERRGRGEGGGGELIVVNYWASGDFMIPVAGRDWFDALMTSTAGIVYQRHELGAGAGHDTPINTTEVVEGIFESVRVHGTFTKTGRLRVTRCLPTFEVEPEAEPDSDDEDNG